MAQNQLTSKAYFRGIRIIHLGLMIGQALFVIITTGIIESGSLEAIFPELTTILGVVISVFGIYGILASHFFFQNKLKSIRQKDNLKEKMSDYRGALISRYARLEGPSFFAIVSYMLSGNLLFLILTGLILVLFGMIRPSIQKAETDLELNPNEIQLINNPESIITYL